MSDVFLSYMHKDRRAADLVYDYLIEKGRSVFLDRRRLEPGSRWEPTILAELQTARCVLVLWSNASIESDWVRREANSGYMRNRLVQALLEPAQLREPFAGLQAADLIGWKGDLTPGLAALADAVDRILRLPVGAPEVAVNELDQLVQRLDTVAPHKQVGQNLLIGTWNLRGFNVLTDTWTASGTSPKRDRRALVAIAEIVRRFDLVVLNEVKGESEALNYLMKILGDEWSVVILCPIPGAWANHDRTALVFDARRLMPQGLFDRISPALSNGYEDSFTRLFIDAPYAAFFRTRLAAPPAVFGLVLLRVAYGIRRPGSNQLSRCGAWLRSWAASERSAGRSLLMLGDFGLDRMGDSAYDALLQSGLAVPQELSQVPRTLFSGMPGRQFVDHVAWMTDKRGRPLMSLYYMRRAGFIDFTGTVYGDSSKTVLSWHVSDHFPLWIELATNPPP